MSRPDRLWTSTEVAEYLQLPLESVYRLTRGKRIPAVNIGTPHRPTYRYSPRALERWALNRSTA